MNKKYILFSLGVVLLVLIAIILIVIKKDKSRQGETIGTPSTEVVDNGLTKMPVPEGAKAPEVGEVVSDESVAVPVAVTNAAPDVEAKLRSFTIKAIQNAFQPSKVIVKKGDTVHIVIEAVDKDYDFVLPDLGMKQVMKKGESKTVEFQAVDSGQFIYYCEQCGGRESSAKGSVIITP